MLTGTSTGNQPPVVLRKCGELARLLPVINLEKPALILLKASQDKGLGFGSGMLLIGFKLCVRVSVLWSQEMR